MSATAGVIAAGDERTVEAGAEMLRAGGNAVDAIIAASCMAFVVEAPLCGPGGAGVLLLGRPPDVHVLDFFAAVPGLGLSATQAEAPREFHDIMVDFGPTTQTFHVGRGAAAVPGTMLGLLEAHRRHGTMPLAELIGPAVAAAREGRAPSPKIDHIVRMLGPITELTPPTRAIFFGDDGRVHLRNPPLADLLEAMAREGEAFVRGPVADALVRACGVEQGGRLTHEDLRRYAPVWREPLQVDRADITMLSVPPPSSGGSLVGLGLRQSAIDPRWAWLGPEHVVELAALLSAMDRVRDHARGSAIDAAGLAVAEQTLARRRVRNHLGSTTHLSVLDETGQLAALTMSNGEGCGHTLTDFGIHVNNFLGEEDINPHGFHRQPPGTWMTTMMAPTAVLRSGRPHLVLGTGGSNRIRSALLTTLLHVVVSGRTLREAVEAPRMHVEGDRLWYEPVELPSASEAALQQAWPGATRFDARTMFFGGVHAVAHEDGELHGVGDARRNGAAAVVRG